MNIMWVKIPLCLISFFCTYEILCKDRGWFVVPQMIIVALLLAMRI